MCQSLLPRSSTNPGSGSGSVSPSMQPAEENQGPGTTQIRHQGFLPVSKTRPSSLNLSIPKQNAAQTSGLSGHDCFSSWPWHRIWGHSSLLLLAETNRIRQRDHTHECSIGWIHFRQESLAFLDLAGMFGSILAVARVVFHPNCALRFRSADLGPQN